MATEAGPLDKMKDSTLEPPKGSECVGSERGSTNNGDSTQRNCSHPVTLDPMGSTGEPKGSHPERLDLNGSTGEPKSSHPEPQDPKGSTGEPKPSTDETKGSHPEPQDPKGSTEEPKGSHPEPLDPKGSTVEPKPSTDETKGSHPERLDPNGSTGEPKGSTEEPKGSHSPNPLHPKGSTGEPKSSHPGSLDLQPNPTECSTTDPTSEEQSSPASARRTVLPVDAVKPEVTEESEEPAEDEGLLSRHTENGKTMAAEVQDVPSKVLEAAAKFEFWGLSLVEKTRYIRSNMSVEPMLAMYIIPSVLASLATQNLNLEKACRVNLGYSDLVCDALSARNTANYTFEESEVQKLTASMAGWKTFIQSSLPALLILFVGSWSDRHGCRKPCMLLPIVGEFLTSISLLVCTYYYTELPIEAATFSEAVFPAMTGGWFVMFMAVFTYIADVTSEADRTFRIGVVNVFFSIGIPIGMALSGVMYRLIGFYGVFSLSSAMYICSFWCGYTMVKEEPKKWTGDGPEPSGVIGFLRDFFDFKFLLETLCVSFKKGKNNRRLRVGLLMLVVILVIGPLHGENTVMYLFVRLQFNWDELNFSLFSTYCVVVNLIGTVLSVGLFSSLLKYDDSVIGMMSCASKILAGFIYAFSVTSTMLLFAPLVDMMNGTSFIAMRSIASKLVPSNELGKVNSLFGACEAMMPMVCGPLYSKVYQMTMHTLPGAFFLMGGVITAPAFVIFGWYYLEAKKDKRSLAEPKESRNDLSSQSVV